YPTVERIIEMATVPDDPRPVMMCEFAHAMGNSCGNLREYIDAIRGTERLIGGFIWDWIDQGIAKTDDQGREYFAYGGDFGDVPNDYNFCINGLIGPDRVPHPALTEYQYLIQPVAVQAGDLEAGQVVLTNRYDFISLSNLEMHWTLEEDGVALQSGIVPCQAIGPGESVTVALDIEQPEIQPGAEYWLNLRFHQRQATPYAEAGHLVAWEQFRLPWEASAPVLRYAGMAPLTLEETAACITVTGDDFALAFDRKQGLLASFQVGGQELLSRGPILNLWRATTDNDRGRHRAEPVAETWQRMGLNRLVRLVREVSAELVSPQVVRVTLRDWQSPAESTFGFASRQVYTIYGSGDVQVHVYFEPSARWGLLPRIGLQLYLAAGYNRMIWFGRGPHESYIDRLASASVGRYSGSVDEQYVPYVMPQENGNKTDVRWVALAADNGVGLMAVGAPYLEVSAHHYTSANLHQAQHTNELQWQPEVELNLDYRQMGLGGASCGPGTRPEYWVHSEPTHYSLRLRALSAGQDPSLVARQALPQA
ncbi:MAG: DUF4981 domain-containing protein, partial [Chloroflexi bacterium]|nr:DUF4981 domain-containing protein [Chloroflexota bacterium]